MQFACEFRSTMDARMRLSHVNVFKTNLSFHMRSACDSLFFACEKKSFACEIITRTDVINTHLMVLISHPKIGVVVHGLRS